MPILLILLLINVREYIPMLTKWFNSNKFNNKLQFSLRDEMFINDHKGHVSKDLNLN